MKKLYESKVALAIIVLVIIDGAFRQGNSLSIALLYAFSLLSLIGLLFLREKHREKNPEKYKAKQLGTTKWIVFITIIIIGMFSLLYVGFITLDHFFPVKA